MGIEMRKLSPAKTKHASQFAYAMVQAIAAGQIPASIKTPDGKNRSRLRLAGWVTQGRQGSRGGHDG